MRKTDVTVDVTQDTVNVQSKCTHQGVLLLLATPDWEITNIKSSRGRVMLAIEVA
jgi:hypothetical protein